jgi:hypothetical protein
MDREVYGKSIVQCTCLSVYSKLCVLKLCVPQVRMWNDTTLNTEVVYVID